MDLPIRSETGTRHRAARDMARWRPLVRGMLVMTAIVLACGFVVAILAAGPGKTGFGFDTRSYWNFPRGPLYPGPGTDDGYGFYRYSPAFVPLLVLVSGLPWPVFAVGWMALLV